MTPYLDADGQARLEHRLWAMFQSGSITYPMYQVILTWCRRLFTVEIAFEG